MSSFLTSSSSYFNRGVAAGGGGRQSVASQQKIQQTSTRTQKESQQMLQRSPRQKSQQSQKVFSHTRKNPILTPKQLLKLFYQTEPSNRQLFLNSLLQQAKKHLQRDPPKKYVDFIQSLNQIFGATPILPIQVMGCLSVRIFKIKDRNQYIYLISERHDSTGNAIDIIDTLVHNLNCPIDILSEERYIESECGYDGQSNICKINKNFKKCLLRGKIPRDQFLFQNQKTRQYFNKCVRPYKGKLKLWAIDPRSELLFDIYINYILTPIIRNDQSFLTSILKEEKALESIFNLSYNTVLDFKLYQEDETKFLREIVKNVEDIFQKLSHTFYATQFRTLKHFFIRNVLNPWKGACFAIIHSKERNEISKMMKDLSKLSEPLINRILTYFKDTALKNKNNFVDNIALIYIMDLYFIIRILKLLYSQDNGIIIGFAGYIHMEDVSNLIKYFEPGDLPFEFENLGMNCNKVYDNLIPFPIIDCPNKTIRMKLYQENSPR